MAGAMAGAKVHFWRSETLLLDEAEIKTAVLDCKAAPFQPFFVVHLSQT